jgi:prepilin-type processing-associated H-X9-DG protein
MASTNAVLPAAGIVGVMGNQSLLNVLYGDWHVGTVTATNFNNPKLDSPGTAINGEFWQPNAP